MRKATCRYTRPALRPCKAIRVSSRGSAQRRRRAVFPSGFATAKGRAIRARACEQNRSCRCRGGRSVERQAVGVSSLQPLKGRQFGFCDAGCSWNGSSVSHIRRRARICSEHRVRNRRAESSSCRAAVRSRTSFLIREDVMPRCLSMLRKASFSRLYCSAAKKIVVTSANSILFPLARTTNSKWCKWFKSLLSAEWTPGGCLGIAARTES
jgi:hypothetical protein